jgi:hypothetical protein
MTLGKIYEHQLVYPVYGNFVEICGRYLFNPTEQTYLDLGFEELPELEEREGYHTAWRVATREVIPEPTEEPEEVDIEGEEEVVDNEEVIEDEEGEEEPTPEPEPLVEEYIEAYYEADPDPEEVAREEAEKRENGWKKEFFQTSLGWVRRKATMKDGSIDNFLTDDLPLLAIALQSGAAPKVIVYSTPDYTQEIDVISLQSYVDVTPQFIAECLQEKQNEFI